MTIEVNGKRTRSSIAKFGRHLMPNTHAFIDGHIVFGPPVAGVLMQFFLMRRDGRHHMINEKGKSLGLGNLRDAEFLFHLLEDDIGVAWKIIRNYIVRLDLDLLSCMHRPKASRTRKNFFSNCMSQSTTLL